VTAGAQFFGVRRSYLVQKASQACSRVKGFPHSQRGGEEGLGWSLGHSRCVIWKPAKFAGPLTVEMQSRACGFNSVAASQVRFWAVL
jgi:hypothetical protein